MLAHRLLAATLVVLSISAQADDCVVSTSPPDRLITLQGVAKNDNYADTGVFTVSFSNGDQILAEYGTCELALSAHYLMQSTNKPDTKVIEEFLAAVIPMQTQIAQLVEQLKAAQPLNLNQPVHLKGTSDSHTLVLKSGTSPFFQFELHYRWQAPLH